MGRIALTSSSDASDVLRAGTKPSWILANKLEKCAQRYFNSTSWAHPLQRGGSDLEVKYKDTLLSLEDISLVQATSLRSLDMATATQTIELQQRDTVHILKDDHTETVIVGSQQTWKVPSINKYRVPVTFWSLAVRISDTDSASLYHITERFSGELEAL
jgi:hypothetical protein